MTMPQLPRKEWEEMMAMVLLDQVSIDPTDKWNDVEAPENKGNSAGGAKVSTEIPDNHPADGGPVTPDEEKADAIPAGGGFDTKPAQTPKTGPVSKETPADGPASSDSPADKPNKVDDGKFAVKVGRPMPTGKPSGSFAQEDALKYDGESWTTKGPISVPSDTVTQWGDMPSGASLGNGATKTPDKWGTPDANSGERMGSRLGGLVKTDPKPSGNMSADEDLDKDYADNLALPDGSFFTQNVDDLQNNIDKVKNADQTNPRAATHPWYTDVKRHLMNRAVELNAQHMIPADWNLSMGMLAEAEMARDIDQATREEYLKKGWAIRNSDGSIAYPIGNASDLRNAMTLARSGHGNVSAAKALIRRRAKDLGVKLPSDF